MKPLSIASVLAAVCGVMTIIFFGIIDITPASLRFSPISQTAAVDASTLDGSATATTTSASAATSGAQKPTSFPAGIVSINFDDGWISSYTTALPIIEAANLPATFYIISSYFGKSAYITVPDMLALQSAGEEIGDHTKTHPNLTRLSADEMQDEIIGSMAQLKADGVHSITTFAYPYGAHNEETNATVLQAGYIAARTIDNGMNDPQSNPHLLLAREVTDTISVAEVEQWINEANARNEWLILVFHQLNPTLLPRDPYSWPTSDFQTIVDYLVRNHITVMTNAAVVSEYFKQ
jgi:peptidoglycan/xylan/chitin deacetylase (PgdA/CDA1 family)